MKISIIIPVYMVEKYLDKCIENVVNQTYGDLEIILVNDGSWDTCPEKCNKWSERDVRIKVIHKKNGGLSSARNAGLDLMSGEAVFFLDSDDLLPDNSMEILINEMVNKNADIVSSGFTMFRADSGIDKLIEKPEFIVGLNELFYLQTISNHACGKLYKSYLFKDVRYPQGRNYEDIATTHLLYCKATIVSHTMTGMYFYRIHQNTITDTINEKNLLDLKWAYRSVKENYPDKSIYNFYLLTILYTLYSRLLRASKEVRNQVKLEKYIRAEFDKIAKHISIDEYRGKSPMYFKLVFYRHHLAGPIITIIDVLRK